MGIFNDLNDQQKEAVFQTEGPVLILAGAGSGKTRALTHRIAYLIKEKKIRPDNILAVTFTNKAAQVMSNRITQLLMTNPKSEIRNPKQAANSNVSNLENSDLDFISKFDIRASDLMKSFLPWLGTFHSICVKILRREAQNLGISSKFAIFDENDALRAIKRAMRALEIPEKKYNPRAVRSYISGAKGELIGARDYQNFAHDHFQKIVARVYLEYEKILSGSQALDFDDLLFKTAELFQKNPEILEKYQNRFRYILIDEYQDTNHAQYMFAKLLAQKHRNIFAIGDDWQSIYSFRGAKFQNILDFKKDYPEAKTIYLEENYRSTQSILDAAQGMIKNNELRSDKNLFTGKGEGAPVVAACAPDKYSEINFILDEIATVKMGESRPLSDFVILYRTNAQSRLFEEKLIERQIPYRIIGGVRFYERREIKDILAYLALIQNSKNIIAFSRIINVPPRAIGEKTLDKIIFLGEKAKSEIPKFAEFAETMDRLRALERKVKVPDLIDKVMIETGYREYLNDGTFESETRLENIEELKTAAAAHENLDEFLEKVALVSDVDSYKEKDNVLTLMTVHSAKGMEFPVVFITGLEEGLFPHSQSLDNQFDLEEERRLFYVGMTRAMNRLYLSYSTVRVMYGRLEPAMPSRFIEELPENKIEFIDL